MEAGNQNIDKRHCAKFSTIPKETGNIAQLVLDTNCRKACAGDFVAIQVGHECRVQALTCKKARD